MTASLTPARQWWTPDELAASGLPDIPGTRQGVQALIDRQGWRSQSGFARRRAGKGGGWEYSWQLLPARAKLRLIAEAKAPVAPPPATRDAQWQWFDGLPGEVKARAAARLAVLQKVEALEGALGKHLAAARVAQMDGVGLRTVWAWFALVEGVRPDDRLAWLAPRNRAAERRARAKDCDPEFMACLKGDYLRLSAPPFTDAYRRSVKRAEAEGWEALPERTMRRKLDRAVSPLTQVLLRQGVEALKRHFPPQVRDKTALTALEAVNADFHKFDVFVAWPAPRGEAPVIGRPQMVAFQDIYSGRILSWRIDVSANATAVQLAAGDMIEDWGIPQHVLFDNGREFAAKAITGGASTRFRFKVKDDDLPGLFTALGCTIHWATPYSGQSKPIERAFRDLAQTIAKDPRFEGAYTGNSPEAKPENYGSRAIPLDAFLKVVAEGIEEHNTRAGRRSEVAFGRSFAEVFDESYAVAPIRKATETQRRFWLLGAEGLRAKAKTGEIEFQGNTFWAPWCHEIAGERIIIRFDPAAFWDGLHVYSADNAWLGFVPCRQKAGFFDADEARLQKRAHAGWLAAEKRAAEAHRRLSAAQIGAGLDALAAAAAAVTEARPEAKVVKPVFGRGNGAPLPEGPATVADLTARLALPAEEGARERFRRAHDLERRTGAGEAITRDQERWLEMFQTTSEYRAERALWDDFGDAIFG